MRVRLLVQFVGDSLFGEPIQELGTFKNIDDAVQIGLSLIDETVQNMFVNQGSNYLKLNDEKIHF